MSKPLSPKGYRKAYASLGDDNRTRFVRVAQEPGTERKSLAPSASAA